MRHAVRQLRDLLALLGQLPLQPRHAPPRGEPQRVPQPRPAAAGPRLLPPGEVVVLALANTGHTSGVAIGLHRLPIPMVAILVMAIMEAVAILMALLMMAILMTIMMAVAILLAILVPPGGPLQPGHPLLLVLPPGQPQHGPPQPRQLAPSLLRGTGQRHQHSLQPGYLMRISRQGETSLYVV